jgi:hypothetical protein
MLCFGLLGPRRRIEDNIKMYPKGIGYGLGSSGTGYGPVAGSYENGNEPSDSIRGGGGGLSKLCDCQLLKNDSVPWSYVLCYDFERCCPSQIICSQLTIYEEV